MLSPWTTALKNRRPHSAAAVKPFRWNSYVWKILSTDPYDAAHLLSEKGIHMFLHDSVALSNC